MTRGTFSLIRYTHYPSRGEFVNIGVILRIETAPYLMAKFSTSRIQHLHKLDPDFDEAMIKLIKSGIEKAVKTVHDREKKLEEKFLIAPELGVDATRIFLLDKGYLDYLNHYYNGRIQFSSPQAMVTKDAQKEFRRMYEMFVADPDELLSQTLQHENPITKKLVERLRPVEKKLDIHYQLKRELVKGLIRGTTLDFIGCNGAIVCGKAIDFETQHVEATAQSLTTLMQVYNALQFNFGNEGKDGRYIIISHKPNDAQKNQLRLWESLTFLSEKKEFELVEVDGIDSIAEYVDQNDLEPFSKWLEKKALRLN